MAVEKIGVVGAGQMGNGIAHVLALAGYDVVLDDINKDALSKAIGLIEKNMQRQAHKGIIKEEQIKPALARIRTTQTLDDLRDRDLVMEAATEDEAVKKKIFQDLCTRISPKAIIATNTSSISVTRLAASTDRPENFIISEVSDLVQGRLSKCLLVCLFIILIPEQFMLAAKIDA